MLQPRLTRKTLTTYDDLGDLVSKVAENVFQPPQRLTVAEWAEKERYINQPGAYVGPWLNATVPYMVEPMEVLSDNLFTAEVFVGPAQCAKALPLDLPIPTPDGWATMADMQPGSKLFGSDGRVCRVVAESPVMRGHVCYRMTFDDGSAIIADAGHLWTVRDLKLSYNLDESVTRKITTREIAETRTFGIKGRNRYAITNAAPLLLPNRQLDIDPYVLGAWLGDGHSYSAWFYAAVGDDAKHIVSQLERAGYSLEQHESKPGVVTIKPGSDRTGYTLRERLRHADLIANKHIPVKYLRASVEQRRALLQGLMDTDGTVSSKGACTFSTSSSAIRDGFVELACSLGYKPKVKARAPYCPYRGERREGQVNYRITLTSYSDDPPFRMARKAIKLNDRVGQRPTESRSRFIVAVEEVTSVPVKCIKVSSADSLFLAGERMVPTHNTDGLIINWIGYSATVDPMDSIVYCPTHAAARDFSIRRVDRLNRHSKTVGAALVKKRDADNRTDKHYDNGMMLSLSHPSVTELAGRPIGRVALTDYDRMPEDVDGDGSPFDLATKRTTTFGTFAMTLAESSPSRELTDTKKIVRGNEAPPTTGILALYNRGDRRRWNWPCPECGSYFEPHFDHLTWETSESNMDSAETVRMQCPHCSYHIHPDQRHEMQQWGVWLKEGQRVENSRVIGAGRRSNIASFWLNGTAAGLTTWAKLVKSYLDAEDEFNDNGSEEALKKFFNTDIGVPYVSKHALADNARVPETLMARAYELPYEEDLDHEDNGVLRLTNNSAPKFIKPLVPLKVRALIGLVDVQQNMFVVQIIGIAPGKPYDFYVVDRFSIRKSHRLDDDGEREWVKPGSYEDDWERVREEVLERSYPLADFSGRKMTVKMTFCDSGGKAGVTTNAYTFFRTLRKAGLSNRFQLVKGDGTPGSPRARITYPDSGQRGTKAGAAGQIPVLLFNPNQLKDTLNNLLDVVIPEFGMIHFPDWLPDWFYAELTAEQRTDKGWINTNSKRNEAWDLLYYAIGACVSALLNIEKVAWDNPPLWLTPWDSNPLVIAAERQKAFEEVTSIDFGAFGKALA